MGLSRRVLRLHGLSRLHCPLIPETDRMVNRTLLYQMRRDAFLVNTPHIAWSSLAARQRIMQTTTETPAAFLAGKPQNHVM